MSRNQRLQPRGYCDPVPFPQRLVLDCPASWRSRPPPGFAPAPMSEPIGSGRSSRVAFRLCAAGHGEVFQGVAIVMYSPGPCRFTASHSAPPRSYRSVVRWPSASREGRSPHSSATSCQLGASGMYISGKEAFGERSIRTFELSDLNREPQDYKTGLEGFRIGHRMS